MQEDNDGRRLKSKDGRTARQIRAEARARVAAKRANRVRYGSKGVDTTEGKKVMFGWWDGSGEFHPMKANDYIKKIIDAGGEMPTHEALLLSPDLKAEYRRAINEAIESRATAMKRADELVEQAEDAVVDLIAQKKAAAKKSAPGKAKKSSKGKAKSK